MKKRTKRDLTLLLGSLLIISALLFTTGQMGRGKLIEKYDKMRTELESIELGKSNMLLEWKHMRETKGKPKSGGKFSEGLLERDGEYANIVGFMVPLEQWLNATEFMLLPLPLECYFCQRPPPRDVMLIKMAEGQQIDRLFETPVLMNGKFTVHQGPDQKFFYTLSEASLGAMDIKPVIKDIKPEHMAPPSEHGGKEGKGLLDPSKARRVSKDATTE